MCTLWLASAATPVIGGQILPLSEVVPGMEGYGLSVFQGREPERFDVVVLGVWEQVAPDTSYILARLSGANLEVSGVVAGMSGSPVYIDGRLVGAVAFAWPFAIEAIAGITPIEAMHRLQDAGSEPLMSSRSPAVAIDQLVAARIDPELLTRHLGSLLPTSLAGATTAVGWSAVGFGPLSRARLAESLGPVTAAGQIGHEAEVGLWPGGSVAAVLVDGDMRLAATGTLTERTDDQILAFGHPFLSVGAIGVPMATTEVITVLSNQLNSFKIVNLGRVVGAFDLDRKSGLRGRVGQMAATTPVSIEIDGERRRRFEVRIAQVPMLTPTLIAISVLGALDAATQAAGEQSLDLQLRFAMSQHGSLEVSQSFDGARASIDAVLYILAFADYLMNNHLEAVELSGVEVALTQYAEPRLATLVDGHATRTRVRPGDEVELNLDLTEYRGNRRRASIGLEIPTGIPDGRYSLLVGDGVSIDVARWAIEQSAPITFSQALALLRSLHSRRQLVVLGVFGGPGLAVSGEVLPQLPGSVRSLWGAAASSSAIPLQLAIAQSVERPLDLPLIGAVRIDLEVHRDDPIGPATATGSEAPDRTDPGETGVAGSRRIKEKSF